MSDRDETARPPTPPDVPRDAPCVVLFGGSFDPVTLAHTTMAARARDTAKADAWLVFIPAARSPFKASTPEASDADRVAMLEIATRSIPRCAIWADEIDRAREGSGRASYTIDTVERARAALPDLVRLRLLIGADQAQEFHRWRAFRKVLEIAPAIVMPRGKIRDGATLARSLGTLGVWSRRERALWSSWLVEMAEMDVSATHVRDLLEAGDDGRLRPLLDDGVLAFIRERHVYATR